MIDEKSGLDVDAGPIGGLLVTLLALILLLLV
jgi:hypothetical protein